MRTFLASTVALALCGAASAESLWMTDVETDPISGTTNAIAVLVETPGQSISYVCNDEGVSLWNFGHGGFYWDRAFEADYRLGEETGTILFMVRDRKNLATDDEKFPNLPAEGTLLLRTPDGGVASFNIEGAPAALETVRDSCRKG